MAKENVTWTPISEYVINLMSHENVLCCEEGNWFRAVYSPQHKAWLSDSGLIYHKPSHFCKVNLPKEKDVKPKVLNFEFDGALTIRIEDDTSVRLYVDEEFILLKENSSFQYATSLHTILCNIFRSANVSFVDCVEQGGNTNRYKYIPETEGTLYIVQYAGEESFCISNIDSNNDPENLWEVNHVELIGATVEEFIFLLICADLQYSLN